MNKIDEIMGLLFRFDPQTYFRWKKEKRIIVTFLNNYFTKDELKEIVSKNGELRKLDIIKNYTVEELEEKLGYQELKLNKNDIVLKLYKFKRASLIYLVNIFEFEHDIINYNSLILFLGLKIEPKRFWESLQLSFTEFKFDLQKENFIRRGFLKRLHDDVSNIFNKEEIEFLVKNKNLFIFDIKRIIEEKR